MNSPLKNLLARLGGKSATHEDKDEELHDFVDQATARGLVEESEREMMHSLIDLGDTLVRELMVPRTDMVFVEGSRTLRQGLSLALRSGFTRIPVIEENLDNVIGIAYVKDLARRVLENREAENKELVHDHLRRATFVPENKNATDLLREMQRNRIHMAIVVDEYGGTAGLITIEDILEEIVGEISDEYDVVESDIEWINERTARISARINVEDLAEHLGITFSEEERHDVDSAGGLLAKVLGRVPIPGSAVTMHGWRLTAEKSIGRRHRIGTILAEKVEVSASSTNEGVERGQVGEQ